MSKSTDLLAAIDELKMQQAQARKDRQAIAKALRNAQRRKRRLKTRARMLSNDDLVAVLVMRGETNTENKPADPADEQEEPKAAVEKASPKKKGRAE